jgi:hypothetical protein
MSFSIGFKERCSCKGGRIGGTDYFYEPDEVAICDRCNGTGCLTSMFADELIAVMTDHPYEFRMALGLGTPMDKAIERSNTLGRLKEGWDDESALPIKWGTLQKAHAFLRFAEYHDLEIPVPDINPVCDGSVDLEWHTEACHVLINFPEDDKKKPTYSWEMGGERSKGDVGFDVRTPLAPLLPKEES